MPMGAQAAAHRVRPCHYLMIQICTIILFSSIFAGAQRPEIASQALLRFKSSLENDNNQSLANWVPSVPPCPPQGISQGNWVSVLCYNGFVWGLKLENMKLKGHIDVDALVLSPFIRTLSLMNNNFEGRMPHWRKIGALKSLYLSNNRFSGPILRDEFKGMNSLKKVHLANNKFTGPIPESLESPKLTELRLENNQFTGPIPLISSDFLKVLNVSNNQLEGSINARLANLDPSSFSGMKQSIVREAFENIMRRFLSLTTKATSFTSGRLSHSPPQSEPTRFPRATSPSLSTSTVVNRSSSSAKTAIIIACAFVGLMLLVLFVLLSQENCKSTANIKASDVVAVPPEVPPHQTMVTAEVVPLPSKKVEQQQPGKLSFVRDDRQKFVLQDLMRASAEVLGSGDFGASYKAILVDGEALVVKRFKQMSNVAKEDFHEHMRRLGGLEHPNLLPLVAYLYRKEEKLLVFNHVPNGSLSQHLHGKHSDEQPGLNWEIRLRIIKGVAKGLAYLKNELPSLIVPHGHLKSSNVLLDKDFNPLLMDYTLMSIVNPLQVQKILVAYKSPEYAKKGVTTNKTDVWCLGILILETLTSKSVAKYLDQGASPYGDNLAGWINFIVEDAFNNGTQVFDKNMHMENPSFRPEIEKLLKIGIACCKEDLMRRLDLEEAVCQIEQIQDSSASSSTDHLG